MRITKEILERRVALLNDMTGAAQEPYKSERDSRGSLIANAGTYYIGPSKAPIATVDGPY